MLEQCFISASGSPLAGQPPEMRSRAPLFSGKVDSKKRLCRSRAVKMHTEINQRLENWGASRAKTKGMGLRLFCKLFVNPIDKVGGQEYIFSSRADRVLKTKQTAPREVCKTMKKNIDTIQSRLCRRRARSC